MPTGANPGPRGRGHADGGSADKPVMPVDSQFIDYNNYLENRGDHIHAGEDWGTPNGTPIYACEDGVVKSTVYDGYGNTIDLNIGKYVLRYAHLSDNGKNGPVKKGDRIGATGDSGSPGSFHLHFEVRTDGGQFGHEGTIAPKSYLTGAVSPGGGAGIDNVSGGGFGNDDIFAVARAAAFSTQLELPGLTETFSYLFTGDKSIYNDQPLLPFIEQLCQASFRHFQSLPNGAFFAFFPDQFGAYGHRHAYWNIDDIEIIDGKMELTDEALATHVFVAGDINHNNEVDFQEMVNSKGVISIFDAFNSERIIAKGRHSEEKEESKVENTPFVKLKGRMDAMAFLRRYGVRPYIDKPTFIRNPYFEVFYAYITFQDMWAKQFLTTFTFTFMPELYPGGIVAFENHGFQAYIESVTHSFDYESGFTTQANLMAPSALDPKDQTPYSQGMVATVPEDFTDKTTFTTKK